MHSIEVPNPLRELVPVLKTVRGSLSYHEDRVRVERSLRDDPLGQMHARSQISDVRYHAGRLWQRYAEMAGTRLKSPGDIQEAVDRSHTARNGLTNSQEEAGRARRIWRDVLGGKGYALLEAVLVDKLTVREAGDLLFASLFDGDTKAQQTFTGHRLRECLDAVAATGRLAT